MLTTKTILAIDDNPANLKLIRVLLSIEGYQVLTAPDAESALAIIGTSRPQLILMDLQLPGMDGLTFMRQLKSNSATHEIPIIALTAYAMKGDEDRASEAGCNGYLTKPIDRLGPSRLLWLDISNDDSLMKNSTILIVDDEPVNRRLAHAILAPLGYVLREASDGDEALEAVSREIPDLVLLDVRMPRQDGYSVCEHLKQNVKTKLIPIIMLTSLHQVEDKIKGIELGVDEFLTKPFHAAELTARVKSLLALKRYTDELENVSFVLKGIVKVVECRDAYTGSHSKRVGDYGAGVALAMGLGAADVKAIHLAGMLHDLGKIGIPDNILLKPGPLNVKEKEIMRTHAAAGATLVEPMNTMAAVLPFIRHHHERLNGSGYPDGLSGHEIPLPVRILSVVDIYDALATRRPYKEAFAQPQCFAILREEAARGWWDRDVVEHLAKSLTAPA